MGEQEIRALLERVRSGKTAPEEAVRLLSRTAYEDLGYAKVDHHRAARQGAAEVIFGQGKTAEQIEGIVRSMMGRGAENIIVTRLSEKKEVLLPTAKGQCRIPLSNILYAEAMERVTKLALMDRLEDLQKRFIGYLNG